MLAFAASRPRLALGSLTAICLAAFLLSIPLPRSDGQLLSTDGLGYYCYLPAAVLDHDLDFSTAFRTVRPQGGPLSTARTATGMTPNPWPVGTAVLWLPFFLLAHALAIALNAFGAGIRLDGYGYWHQAFVLAGSIVYGGLALGLAFGVARRVASSASALWATVLLLCAGNLVYYMTAEPSMAHPASAFAVGLFYWSWIRLRGETGLRRPLLLGISLGLIAMVRAQEVLLALVPLAADFVHAAQRQWDGESDAVTTWLRRVLLTAVTAAIVFLPQAAASHVIFGHWWTPPQLFDDLPPGQSFISWSSPHFADALFSAWRGLFSWHPVYALALLGLPPLWRKNRALATAVVVGVLGQAYVIGCWFYWWQGRAFGARTFIGCLPLFAASLAALFDAVAARRALRPRLASGVLLLATLLVAANLLLFLEYRLVLSRSDRPATWHDLGSGRIEFLSR